MIRKSSFKPAWWLRNCHLQTMWGTLTRKQPPIPLKRERVELPDGDFIDIDWAFPEQARDGTPIVIILHGLGGSVNSHYAKAMLHALTIKKWRGAFMHFRGTSGMPNRKVCSYHCGETKDIHYVANMLSEREPGVPIAAIGYSLGGSVLLNWLAETTSSNLLNCAVAISVPFEMEKAIGRIMHGFSQLYQKHILKEIKEMTLTKFRVVDHQIDIKKIQQCRNFIEFDDYYTAPVHGFKDASDYYHQVSSRKKLKDIHVPTLILHALDDPFMTPEVIPTEAELSRHVELELSEHGGHVGFIEGTYPGQAKYWLERRIIEYFDSQFLPHHFYSKQPQQKDIITDLTGEPTST